MTTFYIVLVRKGEKVNPPRNRPTCLSTFNLQLLPRLNSPRKCNLVMAVPEAVIHPRAGQGSHQSRHGQRRQRSESLGDAADRLPVPLRLQHQPQGHRPQLSLARAVQRFSWHGHVAAHAPPSGVAGDASPLPLQPRQLAGSLRGPYDTPWLAYGFSGAHRCAASWLRKLLPAAPDWRSRNGFPCAEPARFLGHGGLVRRHDLRVFDFPSLRHHAMDRQCCHLLCGVPPQRAQFQRHHHRSPRSGNDAPPAPVDRLGLVHQRHPGNADFQHSSGGLPLLALGSPLEHALFPPVVSPCQSAGRRCHKCSLHPLAAPLLVFRASRSLHRHASVFRPRHASDFHVFSLGFISLFLSGGLSGIFLARQDLAAAAVSDDFVTGHFHLVMGVAATFAILGALFFWFPKLFGRRLNETLGKIHFWLTFAGVYCVFMPMHWLGLIAHSRILSGSSLASVTAAGSAMHSFITVAILLTVFAQGLFLINFLWSLFRGEKVLECNPWRATTLEWSVPSSPADDFGPTDPVVYRGAYEFGVPDVAEDFVPQHIAPEQVVKVKGSSVRRMNSGK